MQATPDYNTANPPTLFVAGVLKGEPVHVDPTSLCSLSNTWEQLYWGELQDIDSDARRAVPVRKGSEGHVAVKVLPYVSRPPRNSVNEARFMATLDHPNILALLNAYSLPPSSPTSAWRLSLFTPLYPLVLSDLLASPTFTPSHDSASFSTLADSLSWQLFSAVEHLHRLNIAHRDISPRNLVMSSDATLVLIDFGVSLTVGDEPPGTLYFELGTGSYRAPELLFASRSYDPLALDLWAVGATLAELFTPLLPVSPPSSSNSDNGSNSDDGSDSSADKDADSDSSDWGEPEGRIVNEHQTEAEEQVLRRKSLFDGRTSDFALIGSIFKVLGTPTVETWPEASLLPDFSRFTFNSFPPTPLSQHLPHLDTASPLAKVLPGLLQYSESSRMTAADCRDDKLGWSGRVELPPGLPWPPEWPPQADGNRVGQALTRMLAS